MARPIYAKAIFFDAVGTLFRVRGSVGEIYWELARPYGVKATPGEIEEAFQEVFPETPALTFSRLKTGQLRRSEKEWWKSLVRNVFGRVGMISGFDRYFDEVFRAFSGLRGWVLYPETRKILGTLKKSGFTLGIISNFDSRLLTVCSDLQIFQYLDSIHVSSRSGSAKPDPGIFRKALAYHGLQAREAVHIGDSIAEDVRGAQAVGMIPVHISRDAEYPEEDGVLSIKDLAQIIRTIEPM